MFQYQLQQLFETGLLAIGKMNTLMFSWVSVGVKINKIAVLALFIFEVFYQIQIFVGNNTLWSVLI